jgi:predicted RNase H-like nuclease (RuvC/YqgF family)
MIKEMKKDFINGVEKIKWFSRIISERLKIEITIIKLLYRSDDMDRTKDEMLLTIGKRVYELKENTERNLLKDREIVESIAEIERLEKEIVELNQKISELTKAGT